MIGFLSGIASGVTKLLVGHPFDTLKIRMQTEGIHGRFTGSWDCLKKTVGKEGFFAMYKGATPPLFGWSIMDSVQMGSLTTYRMLLQDSRGELSLLDHAVAGFGCGITVSFVASPVEIIKAKLQIQYDAKSKLYTGPIDCARHLIREDGVVKGLYRGLSGTLLFRSFFWVLWGSYEIYSRKLEEWGVEKSLIPFFSGGTYFVCHERVIHHISTSTTSIIEWKHFTNLPSMHTLAPFIGLAANTFWTISFPADVIKNRLMTRPAKNPLYTNIPECVRYIWKKEGWRGFYRGFVPCFLRSFPTNASAIFVFQTCFDFGKRSL